MIKKLFLLLLYLLFQLSCSNKTAVHDKPNLVFEINKTVTNQNLDYFNDVLELWKNYLISKKFYHVNNEYWDQSMYQFPEASIAELLLYIQNPNRNYTIHCTIMGIIPHENNHYDIKSIFHHFDDNGELIITYSSSIICKKEKTYLYLVSRPQYLKQSLNLNTVDNYIDFYTHKSVEFNEVDANKMANFNTELSKLFNTQKLSFEVFRNATTEEAFKFKGLDFTPGSYYHMQISGRADTYNEIIYADNNSEFYPHELVHMYTKEVATQRMHSFIDEGIATLLGGSADKDFIWHKRKLKKHLSQNPEFIIPQINNISGYLPNGENTTTLLYVIAATICEEIYSNKGIDGLIAAINCGHTDEQLFTFLELELGVKQNQIPIYLKNKILENTEDNVK